MLTDEEYDRIFPRVRVTFFKMLEMKKLKSKDKCSSPENDSDDSDDFEDFDNYQDFGILPESDEDLNQPKDHSEELPHAIPKKSVDKIDMENIDEIENSDDEYIGGAISMWNGDMNLHNTDVNKQKSIIIVRPNETFCPSRCGLSLNLEKYEPNSKLSAQAANCMVYFVRSEKTDQNTVEKVLDPSTRKILLKLLHGDVFEKLDGCMSSSGVALSEFLHDKIFPYSRLPMRSVPIPRARFPFSRVLIMEFIGNYGIPTLKLKEHKLQQPLASKLYYDFKVIHNNELIIINVGEAVNRYHPNALECFRKDCNNITDFFTKQGISTMAVKELFDFIKDKDIKELDVNKCLANIYEKMKNKDLTVNNVSEEAKFDSAVPKKTLIQLDIDEFPDDENYVLQLIRNGTIKEINGLKIKVCAPGSSFFNYKSYDDEHGGVENASNLGNSVPRRREFRVNLDIFKK